MNPLDRAGRNDLNYNFSVVDEAIEGMATEGTENNARFTKVENDVTALKKEDAKLSDRISKNEQAIASIDIDKLAQQGDEAEQKGNEAKRKGEDAELKGIEAEQKGNEAEQKGIIAETKGKTAEQQGDYAKQQGDYAKEKGEAAAKLTADLEVANEDLSQIKLDAVEATSEAVIQSDYAKQQGNYAKEIGDTVSAKLTDIEDTKDELISDVSEAIETVSEKGNTAEQQGLKAKEQGDYAQSVIDSYKHVGDWQGSVEYKTNQEVLYNGSTYRAIEDNKGTQPTDKSKWQLIAQRGVDGEGAVASVNGIMPDSDGNVNLGDIASKEYVDDKIGDVDLSALETKEDATAKLTEAKQYTDTQISEIPEVDLTPLETKEGAQAKLTEAKQYTDEKIGDVDLSALETKEDATAKLEEAKGYTDGEIAKIPDVESMADTLSAYEKYMFFNKANGHMQIGEIDESIKKFQGLISIGKVPDMPDDATIANGSINISPTISFMPKNEIQHRSTIALGTGIKTLREGNAPDSDSYSVTYIGSYNKIPTDNSTMFLVGIGKSDLYDKTGMRMGYSGDLMINGQYKTSGADYAEMFEWEDKNPDNVDRVALAVTWGDGESIKLANSGDEIIGIVSATAAILGDNPDEWDKRFVTDQFGRPLRKEYTEINEDGEEETYEWFVENPEYDKDAPYISRSDRPEWSAIGLMGKLYWIDDGTLEVGDYATVGSNGVATKGDKSNGYRVMKRISKNVDGNSGVVKVFFK